MAGLLFSVVDSQCAKFGRGLDRKRSIRVKDATGRTLTAKLLNPSPSLSDESIAVAAGEGVNVTRSEPYGNGEAVKVGSDVLAGDPATTLVSYLAMNERELDRELKAQEKAEAKAKAEADAQRETVEV